VQGWLRNTTKTSVGARLAIRDLKDQALAHFPSGDFHANGAWTVIAAIAHNPLRWIASPTTRCAGSNCSATSAASSAPPEPRIAGCSGCPVA